MQINTLADKHFNMDITICITSDMSFFILASWCLKALMSWDDGIWASMMNIVGQMSRSYWNIVITLSKMYLLSWLVWVPVGVLWQGVIDLSACVATRTTWPVFCSFPQTSVHEQTFISSSLCYIISGYLINFHTILPHLWPLSVLYTWLNIVN